MIGKCSNIVLEIFFMKISMFDRERQSKGVEFKVFFSGLVNTGQHVVMQSLKRIIRNFTAWPLHIFCMKAFQDAPRFIITKRLLTLHKACNLVCYKRSVNHKLVFIEMLFLPRILNMYSGAKINKIMQ